MSIFTDGSSRSGRGGFGFLLSTPHEEELGLGLERRADSTRMELLAIAAGLCRLRDAWWSTEGATIFRLFTDCASILGRIDGGDPSELDVATLKRDWDGWRSIQRTLSTIKVDCAFACREVSGIRVAHALSRLASGDADPKHLLRTGLRLCDWEQLIAVIPADRIKSEEFRRKMRQKIARLGRAERARLLR